MKYLIALLLAGCVSIPTNDIPDEIVEWSQTNVWRVRAELKGSGFWYDDKTFITTCHVIGDANEAVVNDYQKKWVVYLDVISCNKVADIAILQLNVSLDFTPQKTILLSQETKQGKFIYGAGYPLGYGLKINPGYFQLQSELELDMAGYTVSVPTTTGDSGSPVFIIKNGEVVVLGMRKAVFAPYTFIEGTMFYGGAVRIERNHMAIIVSSKLIYKEVQNEIN